MAQIVRITLPYNRDLRAYLAQEMPAALPDYRILSQAFDAREASRGRVPRYHYTLEYGAKRECPKGEKFATQKSFSLPPVIVGAGPAGLFCALRFAEYNIPTIIVERGESAPKRMGKIARFWRYGQLDPETNVCFGEGGAGLFSDGKLLTRIKSPYISYIMRKFVHYGAPSEVAWVANPHLGSHKIRKIISAITADLKSRGHSLLYGSKVVALEEQGGEVKGVVLADGRKIFSNHIILATGHSARELYHYAWQKKVAMQPKPFAVGVRIEHPRAAIDSMQYGALSTDTRLGAARYRLSWTDWSTQKGIFSFCMCPGGYVLSSGTERDALVTNGMSNYACNSPWSNAALVVQVKSGVDFAAEHPLEGLRYQEAIERKAFQCSESKATGRELPAMYAYEFLEQKVTDRPLPRGSAPSGLFKEDLCDILPSALVGHLTQALRRFERRIPGFASHGEAILVAPETRTSSPVTFVRDAKTLVSSSHHGLYPCGEGAGYAGGITSAAVDGIRVCEAILSSP